MGPQELLYVIRAKNDAKKAGKEFADDLRRGASNTKKVREEARKAATETRKLAADTKKIAPALKSANIQARLLSRGMKAVAASLGAAVGGFVAILLTGALFRDAIQTAIGFEKALSDVAAVGNFTAEQLKQVEEVARDLGQTTVFSARQAAGGIEFLVRAGFDAGEALNAIPTALKLAQAGNLDLARSADIASNILSAARLEVSDFTRVGDTLATIAATANVNIEQLGASFKFFGPSVGQFGFDMGEAAAAVGILGNNGIQGALAGSSLRAIMARLVRITPQAAKVMKEVGLTAADINPEFNSLSQIIEKLADAQINARQGAILFGTEAQGVVNILRNSVGEFKRLSALANDSGGALDALAFIMGDNLDGALKGLRSAIEEFYISLVNTGAITSFVQFITAVVRAVTPAREALEAFTDTSRDSETFMAELNKRVEELQAKLDSFAKGAVIAVDAIKALGQALLLVTVGGRLVKFLVAARTAVVGLSFSLSGGLVAALRLVSVAFFAIPIVGWVAIAIFAIQQLMKVTFEWGGEVISVGEVVSEIFSGVWETIKTTFELIKTVGAAAFSPLFAVLDLVGLSVTDVVVGVGDLMIQMVDIFNKAVQSIGIVLSNLPTVFRAAFTAAINAAIQVVQDGINIIINALAAPLAAIDALSNTKIALKLGIEKTDLASLIPKADLQSLKIEYTDEAGALTEKLSGVFDKSPTLIGDVLDNIAAGKTAAKNEIALSAREAALQVETAKVATDVVTQVRPTGTGDGTKKGGAKGDADALNKTIEQLTQTWRDNAAAVGLTKKELEDYKITQQLLNAAAQAGTTISQEAINGILATRDAYELAGQAQDTFFNGAKQGWEDFVNNVKTSSEFAKDLTGSAFKGMSGLLSDFVTTGKADFKGLIVSLLAQISQFLANQLLIDFLGAAGGSGGAAGGTKGLLGGIVKGIGGIFGAADGASFAVGQANSIKKGNQAFPKYADGGSFIVGGSGGVDSKLVQFMASPNERVSIQRPEQVGNGGGGRSISVSFNFPNADVNSFRRSEGQIGARMARVIADADRKNN